MVYTPHSNYAIPPGIVIGTPLAVESALVKIRNKASVFEVDNQIDRSQVPGGFDHYKW
jgi:hypothetical protein